MINTNISNRIDGIESYMDNTILRDNNSILNEIIDLNQTLSTMTISNSQISYLANKQLHLINIYTKQIRDRVINNSNDNFKLLYNLSTHSRMNDTITLRNPDKYKPKGYFRRKMKDFRSNLNIYYIEISHKFHKLFRKLKSTYNLVVRDYLYSLIRIQYPRYREYKKQVKAIKIYNRYKLNKELNQ